MATCALPDPGLGIALRLSTYLDCQARALGENGFQALAGSLVATSLVSGLVTIFIALIGYRMILGYVPDLRDGVSWVTRLGIVLALVTSWPAFQVLVYRVAVDGPDEIAKLVLPSSGLPSQETALRVQQAYDTIRLGLADVPVLQANGSGDPAAVPAVTSQTTQFQTPLPNTATMFVISTVGLAGALRLGIGFLLSVAPFAILALLFDFGWGLFAGWLRALGALVLAVLGVAIGTSIDLVLVESELAGLQQFRLFGTSSTFDPQALTTIVMLFGLVMLIIVAASFRMAGALGLYLRHRPLINRDPLLARGEDHSRNRRETHVSERSDVVIDEQRRVSIVAEMLAKASQRDEILVSSGLVAGRGRGSLSSGTRGDEVGVAAARSARRRTSLSRSRSSARRDGLA